MEKFLLQISDKLVDLIFDVITDQSVSIDLTEDEIKRRKSKIRLAIYASVLLVGIGIYFWLSIDRNGDSGNDQPTTENNFQTEISFTWESDIENNYFDLVRMDNTYELVKDNIGLYYYVDFLVNNDNSTTKRKIFYFPKGKYILENQKDKNQLYKSINEFKDYITEEANGKEDSYQIFIRGKADKLTFSEPQDMIHPYIYDRVKYLPRRSEYDYQNSPGRYHHFNGYTYRNYDLPYLRAIYIQKSFEENGLRLQRENSILEGEVSEDENEFDRNVEVILYLPAIYDKD